VGIDIDLNVGDIRHPTSTSVIPISETNMSTEKRHSDLGSIPISTSEFIPLSDIEENKYFFLQIRTRNP
jgi:hypothetical protein